MRPPADLPLELVLLGEAFARRAGIDPGDWWDFVYRRRPWPPDLRAALVEAFYPALTSPEETSTIRTMSTSAIVAPRGPGRPVSRKAHPLFAAMAAKGITLAEEAAEVKRSPASVRSFTYDVDNAAYRPCPRPIAEHWKRKYKIPLSTWPRLAD